MEPMGIEFLGVPCPMERFNTAMESSRPLQVPFLLLQCLSTSYKGI